MLIVEKIKKYTNGNQGPIFENDLTRSEII